MRVFLPLRRSLPFQSTLPRRERRCILIVFTSFFRFQSTLPRRERPIFRSELAICIYVSIHAPTKGATILWRLAQREIMRFNPRSHEGSDKLYGGYNMRVVWFQSTLPRRERRSLIWIDWIIPIVSIHAPTKGATTIHIKDLCSIWFQSTLPRRERRKRQQRRQIQSLFQSTLPRRERPAGSLDSSYGYIQFQSTLPRRERHTQTRLFMTDCLFQSTLPRRERPGWESQCGLYRCFNPRSHEGSDGSTYDPPPIPAVSIHAPTKGATRSIGHQG